MIHLHWNLQTSDSIRQRDRKAELAKKANALLPFVDAPELWMIHLPLRNHKEIVAFDGRLGSNEDLYNNFVRQLFIPIFICDTEK